jgi:serine/threonine protein kinase
VRVDVGASPLAHAQARTSALSCWVTFTLVAGTQMVMKKIFVANKTGDLNMEHEANILASLDHPHVVRFHESFLDPDREHLCIIQDYCDGGNLQQRINKVRA